jgi:hypothetical protein
MADKLDVLRCFQGTRVSGAFIATSVPSKPGKTEPK